MSEKLDGLELGHFCATASLRREFEMGRASGWSSRQACKMAQDEALSTRLLGRYDEAIREAERALELARNGVPTEEIHCLVGLGGCLHDAGYTARAVECFERALELSVGTARTPAACVSNLSVCYGELGDFDDALECAEAARKLLDRIGSPENQGLHCHNMALALIDLGELERAIEHSREGIGRGRAIRSPRVCAYCYETLTLACLLRGDFDAFWKHCEAGAEFQLAEVDHHRSVLRGIAAWLSGDRGAAERAFAQSIDQARSLMRQNRSARAALDSLGFALLGLHLCGHEAVVGQAVDMFHGARAASSNHGELHRVRRLLGFIERQGEVTVPSEVRRAALTPQESSASVPKPSRARRYRLLAELKLRDFGPMSVLKFVKKGFAEQEEATHADLAKLHELQAKLCEYLKDQQAALHHYESALDALDWMPGEPNGHYVDVLKHTAGIFEDLGDYAEAGRVYRRGLRRCPNHANLHGVYAFFVFFADRDVTRARSLFERWDSFGEHDSNILANYALLEVASGNHEAAKGLLARALKSGSATPQRSVAKVWFLSAVMALVEGDDPRYYLRRLKSALSAGCEAVGWPVGALLPRIRGHVDESKAQLLQAVAEAIGTWPGRRVLEKMPEWASVEPFPPKDFSADPPWWANRPISCPNVGLPRRGEFEPPR